MNDFDFSQTSGIDTDHENQENLSPFASFEDFFNEADEFERQLLDAEAAEVPPFRPDLRNTPELHIPNAFCTNRIKEVRICIQDVQNAVREQGRGIDLFSPLFQTQVVRFFSTTATCV